MYCRIVIYHYFCVIRAIEIQKKSSTPNCVEKNNQGYGWILVLFFHFYIHFVAINIVLVSLLSCCSFVDYPMYSA